jgi:vitamin B12 transporter
MLPVGIGVFRLRSVLFVAILSFIPPSLLAQGRDTLRRVQGTEVTVEDARDREYIIKAAPIRSEQTKELQLLSGSSRMSEIVLQMSPSLSARKYGSLGGIALISYRGLPPEYTVVFRDGIRITNEQNSLTDFARITSSSVETIEMLSSTSAILLGGDAIGAAINLKSLAVTSDRISLGSSVNSYDEQSLGEVEYSLQVSSVLSDTWAVGFSGTRQYSQGDYPFMHPVSHREVIRENNDAQLHDLLLTVQHRSEVLPLTLRVNHLRAERGAPGPTVIPNRGANTLAARQYDEDLLVSVSSDLKSGSWLIEPSLAYQRQYETYRDLPLRINDEHDNMLMAASLRASTSILNAGKLYVGAAFEPSRIKSTAIDAGEAEWRTRSRLSGYSALAYTWTEKSTASVALRGEYHTDIQLFELLPQASVAYEILPELVASASFGLSYHAPTLNQLYWKTLGRTSLEAEHATNGEIGLQHHVAIGESIKVSPRVSAFQIRARNQILWLQTEGNLQRAVNVQRSIVTGAEISIDASWNIASAIVLGFQGGYTLLDAANKTDDPRFLDKRLPHSSRTQSVAGVTFGHERFGTLGLQSRYRGSKYADLGNTEDRRFAPATTMTATYAAPAIMLARSLQLDLQLTVDNFTNEQYSEIFNYPLPGRSIRLSTSLIYIPN